MIKRKYLIWISALYFGLLFKYFSRYTVWGKVGPLQTGESPDGTIEVSEAVKWVEGYAHPLQQLVWMVGIGTALTLLLACIITFVPQKESTRSGE
jgi:hypothetical protein